MKIKYAALAVLGAAALCSCDLDEKFYHEASPDTFFTSPENIYSILGRPFYQVQYQYNQKNAWLLEELTSDEMVCPAQGNDFWNGGEYLRLHEHTWTPEDRFLTNNFNQIGYVIARAFEAREDLAGVNYTACGLTEQDKADHLNQLNVVVAFGYMLYLNSYGGVPLYTSSQEAPKPRSTAREVFDFIETELTNALPLVKPKASLDKKQDGYISQGAVAMLLAKLYMNAEAYIGESRFDQAETLLTDLLAGKYGPYKLDSTWYGPHDFDNETSPEAVWYIPSETNKLEYDWMYQFCQISGADVYFDCAFPKKRNNGYMLAPSRETPDGPIYDDKMGKSYEKFHAKDLRKKPYVYNGKGEYEGMFCVGLQKNPRTGKVAMGTRGGQSGKEMIMVDCVNKDGKGSHYRNADENSGVRLVKMPIPNTEDILLLFNPDLVVLRLTEAQYWLAECKWRKGKGEEAARLINEVRRRNFEGGNDPDPVPANFDIYRLADEYLIEFLGEGHRRTDLIRLGLFTTESWWAHTPTSASKNIFCIPSEAITANPLIVQSPGY